MEKTALCVHCNTKNDGNRKFCNACGSPMGHICNKCGSVNSFEDQFCGICGLPIEKKSPEEIDVDGFERGNSFGISKQYSISEIEELLSLRTSIVSTEKSMDILFQDDIDALFGQP